MNILVFGKNGQLGSNFYELLSDNKNYKAEFADREDVDFTQLNEVQNFLDKLNFKPDYIINCIAYTAVDKAEDEREICNAINVNAVKIIADFCKKIDAKLIHYSTDYVFDGSGELPFTEENSENLNPINYYGETKLNSEKEIINSGCKYFIFRISWVYNHSGKNFPFTILKLASERDELKIVADQVGSPCYSMDIAKATLKIIENKSSDFGIYHLTPEEYISWFEFAKIIVEKARKYSKPLKVKGILPIKTSEFPVRAKRPLNSRLDSSKALKILGIKLPKIENSLEEFFKKI